MMPFSFWLASVYLKQVLTFKFIYAFRVNGGKIDAPAWVSVTKRVPLAELPLNVESPFSNKESNVKGYDQSPSDVTNGSLSGRTVVTPIFPAESLHPSDFETPRKETECSKPLDYFATTGLLDDDFDDFILEQIDDLCKQKSSGKPVEHETENNFQGDMDQNDVIGDVNQRSGFITAIEGVRSDDLLDCVVDFDPKYCNDCQKSIQHDIMPEEYLKYLQSLNDRQREAACTDISIPLMIVAGPGSGKVVAIFFFLHC